jgi:hypothetical protein
MVDRLSRLPLAQRALDAVRHWQAFTETRLGQRLLPLYAALLGAGLGALVADRLVRSMWRHAVFTGPNQWRTVAIILTLLWIAIGAVVALAVLGPSEPGDGGRELGVGDRAIGDGDVSARRQ